MWGIPRPGLEPMFPALAGRFLTTAPPGKPLSVSFKACDSLFIFILDDLSIGESGVLKSPTIIVLLSISPLEFFIYYFQTTVDCG